MTGYKVVIVLKNGARVSIFAPKELGLRKTYHANGQPLKVDSGMVFKSWGSAKEFVSYHAWYVPQSMKIEIWRCDYKIGSPPVVKIGGIADWKAKLDDTKKKILAIFTRVRQTRKILGADYDYIMHPTAWPSGTVCAADIVLTEKVESTTGT